jgi:2-polyprenyl-3-methyl-5-hydroxy-6-metoxy-1,4-benzoquinol methylase
MSNLFMLREEEIRSRLDINYNREFLYYKDLPLFFEKFKKSFQSVDCVACKSENHYILTEKDGFSFKKCDKCQTVFISPRPEPEALDWWYGHSEHIKHSQEILRKTADKRQMIYDDRIDKLFSRTHNSVKSVLEIGCGTGNFLKLIKTRKPELKVTGVDLSPEAVELAKEKGIDCFNVSAEAFAKENSGSYDLILAFEVLEHVFDPFSLIRALVRLLEKKGTICMTMPNYLSYDFLHLGDVYKNFFGPDHLNYYNQFSIKTLLEQGGCDHIEIFCDGILDTAIVANYHSDKKKMSEGFWKYIYDNKDEYSSFLVDYQKLLQKYKLSGNMTVVARKS